MKWIKNIFDFYINASVHVALAVYAFVRITEKYFGLSYNEPLDYFIFYGTISGYNFVKYAGVAKFHHRSLTSHLKIIQIFSLVCFLLLVYYTVQLSLHTLLFLSPLVLLTLLYAIPFLSGFQKNLRSISYLKIIVVAFVWAGVTVLLPLHDADKDCFSSDSILRFVQRFLFVIVLILPFDIRDVKYDAISLQTIPKKIGIAKTKLLGLALLLGCLLLELFSASELVFKMVFSVVSLFFFILLLLSKENQPKYFSSFIVESIPIIWLLLLSFL